MHTFVLTVKQGVPFNTAILIEGNMFPQGKQLDHVDLPLGKYFNEASCETVVRSWNETYPELNINDVYRCGGDNRTFYIFSVAYNKYK